MKFRTKCITGPVELHLDADLVAIDQKILVRRGPRHYRLRRTIFGHAKIHSTGRAHFIVELA